jgi:hypothetical protein
MATVALVEDPNVYASIPLRSAFADSAVAAADAAVELLRGGVLFGGSGASEREQALAARREQQ